MPTLIEASLSLTSGLCCAVAVIAGAQAFYGLAHHSVSLLDTFLDEDLDEDGRHARVVRLLGPTILALLVFIAYLAAIFLAAAAPILLAGWWSGAPFGLPSASPLWFWGLFSLGSLLPFGWLRMRDATHAYTPIERLLHRLALNNQALSRALFRREVRRGPKVVPQPYLIVSGLARAGTTALTKMLSARGRFESLRYSHMPFLMSPRLWSKINRSGKGEERERSHGDGVTFGLNSVEALEEYFWRTQMRDAYISEEALLRHQVPAEVYANYSAYRQLIVSDERPGMYLAKNNNFLLRYASVRGWDPDFHFICLFRKPLDHASSLLNVHRRFTEQQLTDPFVLEYMNWLGHHEFGLGYRPFSFGEVAELRYPNTNTVDHWLESWLRYYEQAILFVNDERTYFIAHDQVAEDGARVLSRLSRLTGVEIDATDVTPYVARTPYSAEGVDEGLLSTCNALYDRLNTYSISLDQE